jgi:hypothetical protein
MTTECREGIRAAAQRDSRHGEILLINRERDHLKVAVYSTAGLNECPEGQWRSLDPHRLAKDLDVLDVRLDGPRFWAVDELALYDAGETLCLDGLNARLVGETFIPPDTNFAEHPIPYRDVVIGCKTEWVISRGRPLSKLVSPDGVPYYMVAYSRAIDDSLSSSSLTTLGNRLQLPEGWRYRVGSPVSDLVLRPVAGEAHVMRDEFANMYLRAASASVAPEERRRHQTADGSAVKAAFTAHSTSRMISLAGPAVQTITYRTGRSPDPVKPSLRRDRQDPADVRGQLTVRSPAINDQTAD